MAGMRNKTDRMWGSPIWMTQRSDMPNNVLDENAYAEMARAIIDEIRYA
jgi:hypothetical protein